MGPDRRQLVVLATQIAESLVAAALQRLLGDAHDSEGGRVTINVAPAPTRRLLPAAAAPSARRGRKPGPKPGRRRGRPPNPKPATRPEAGQTPRSARVGEDGFDLRTRRCRHCKRIGTASRVGGTVRTVRCAKCGATWDLRLKASEMGPAPSPVSERPRRPTASRAPTTACRRCDHDADQHELNTGRCLVPRCVCTEFYQ